MSDRQLQRQMTAERIGAALEEGQFEQAKELFLNQLPGDQVEVFNLLEDERQTALLEHLDVDATADLFDRLEDAETLEAAESLSLERLADVLEEMEPDEAADLLGDLPPEQASLALQEMEDTEGVLPLLGYPDETAGGRMTTDFIALHRDTTSAEAIERLRHIDPDIRTPYYLFIVDREDRLSGVVGLRELVVAAPDRRMEAIMNPDVTYVAADTDQEAVARIMVRHDLSSLPVVDAQRQLLGVITHDDILDVITEEATEDIYRLANVGDVELEPESPVREQLRGRLPWLYLNTLTALFAAWVISRFESLIAAVAVLAVFQSVVAGQGGNAASQSVAMFVRALALGKVSPAQVWRLLGRQVWVGFLQGIAVGVMVGLGVFLWRGDPYLASVLGLAIVGNMIVAGIAGTLVPLGLKAIGQDPALASSVLVTALTDSLGFFIFLSLASIFQSYF